MEKCTTHGEIISQRLSPDSAHFNALTTKVVAYISVCDLAKKRRRSLEIHFMNCIASFQNSPTLNVSSAPNRNP